VATRLTHRAHSAFRRGALNRRRPRVGRLLRQRLLVLLRWRRCRRLLLQLLTLLLLFLLGRHVVSYNTTGGGAQYAMVAGDMAGYAAHDGSLDATLGSGGLRSDQERDTEHSGGERLQLHIHG
jgi:hypothetical protein